MGTTHARAVRAAGGVVKAVVTRPGADVDAACAAVGAERGTPELAAVLADPDIDVVHVCTPNGTHERFAAAAIDAGKHVVCEKPLTTSGAAAARLVAAASARAVIAAVPFVYRFHPMVREMRARATSGALGRVSVVQGSYLQDWLAASADMNWRVDTAIGGRSRAFADIGSHWCDLFEFVTSDRIEALSARLKTVFPVRGTPPTEVATEDAASVHFVTRAGVLGSLVVSQTAAGRKNRLYLEVSGSEASLAFDQEEPEQLWIGRRSCGQVILRDPNQLQPEAARYAYLPAGHAQGYQDCFNAFVADVYTGICETLPAGTPLFADGLRAARLCDAVMSSAAADGAWTRPVTRSPRSAAVRPGGADRLANRGPARRSN
jgi:predicted dehydrogenase